VVDADGRVAERVVESLDRRADDGRAQVADGHRLRDVRRGEVDDDRLAGADLRVAVGRALLRDLAEDGARELAAVDLEVDVGARRRGRDAFQRVPELRRQLARDRRRRLLQRLRERKAGEREIAHRRIARLLDAQLGRGQAGGRRQRVTDPVDEGVHGESGREGIRPPPRRE
jgi:hypothetical protein